MTHCNGLKLETGEKMTLGIDIGSTTAKIVLVKNGSVVFECYERHMLQVRQKTLELVERIAPLCGKERLCVALSGSAGLGVARTADIPFVQEVFATAQAVRALEPEADAVIELGGEDAKIIFFRGGLDQRMNGSCAGGTGAFIDQMATLMDLTPGEMDELSLKCERLYPIASRCGVFAKTDIQPLLNQGAHKEDIAASIYQAVVDQTITGLAQGRRIEGKVLFFGGPLYYCKGLRKRFTETLRLSEENAVFPEYGLYAVALGAALYAAGQRETFSCDELMEKLRASLSGAREGNTLPPLFASKEEYGAFCARHQKADVPRREISSYEGRAYLGIDCGSTTTKLVLTAEDRGILYSYYSPNKGDPVQVVKEQLTEIRRLCGGRIVIAGSAVTGYGEELIRHGFRVDAGFVETMAHFRAARHFCPDVDFILDIGGQDIKCLRIRQGSIDSILLNEACSSGCGSFIETFARSMGYGVEEFARLGLFASSPVDLGSRCTVFMNSSVRQAQKEGATVADISAGLSASVVKNALYKVIRANSPEELGERIVVQGGTFHNDAVLRSFERETGREVIRPCIAGLMGAYGAALYAQGLGLEQSSLLTLPELEAFTHTSRGAACGGCGNHCQLTVYIFSGGERLISGNQCERGAGLAGGAVKEPLPNLYRFKREKLEALMADRGEGPRGVIGLPLALGMLEQAPFWHGLFRALGFSVVFSGLSSRKLYAKGQYSIPSDTVCYPAKLMHGHIEALIEQKPDAIFAPCLTYNFDEKQGDNHYNCPVVAYYPELLHANMESLRGVKFLYPYLNLNSEKELAKELHALLEREFGGFTMAQVRAAVKAGQAAYDNWMEEIRQEGRKALAWARKNGKRIMILSGRPYHIDPEIGHGIDNLASSLGFVVVSEDSVAGLSEPGRVGVLNQWTYHSRLYAAARYAAAHGDCHLVQLVSFGCGIDAITTDEVRAIVEGAGRLYTQIKIDEITNLGAVKIRLRSLLGALAERE